MSKSEWSLLFTIDPPQVGVNVSGRGKSEEGSGRGWAVEVEAVEGLAWPPAGALSFCCWLEVPDTRNPHF
jgi:hypothetical protein